MDISMFVIIAVVYHEQPSVSLLDRTGGGNNSVTHKTSIVWLGLDLQV